MDDIQLLLNPDAPLERLHGETATPEAPPQAEADLPGHNSPGWSLIRRLWAAGFSLTIEPSADGKPLLVPVGHGRDDPGLFEQFDAHHADAAKIVAGWPAWLRDPAVLSEVPADSDGWPADSVPADWTCERCGGIGWWESVDGDRHCMACEAERFERSRRLAERVVDLKATAPYHGKR